MYLKWDKEILTGIKEIDDQHKELFQKINKLIENLEVDGSDENFFNAIDFLKRYAFEHFESEEKYFAEIDYPNKEEHEQEHEEFVQKINDIEEKGKIFGSAIHLSIELNAYLLNWWYIHIKQHDKKLALFMKEKNILQKD